MHLPRPLRIHLIEKFTPLLYLDVGEPAYPVSPADYAEHCALWSSLPPDHLKNNWGLPAGSDRQPLVARGNIQSQVPLPLAQGHERWLDFSGWQDGTAVTPTSLNRRSAERPGTDLVQPWYSADVWGMDDLAQTLGPTALAARFGLDPADRPPQIDGVVVVSYHFQFPVHRQPRHLTTHPPADDPYSGDYEGDWTTFAVVTRAPNVPGDALAVDDCVPIHGAFGQRWRPVAPDHAEHVFERMVLRPWGSVLKVGHHPVVVAAPGTHNLYPHDEPKNPDGTITIQWFDEGQRQSEPANNFARDSTEEPFSKVFALKVLAGFLLAGPFGAAIAGAAAGAEAADAEEEGLYEPPKLNPDPPPESDDPLGEDASDIEKDKIGKPQSVPVVPLADPRQSETRDWRSSPEEALLDDSLLLSPEGFPDRHGFDGRWGVRCTNDPVLIRSGIRFPSYRSQIIDALLTQS